MSPLIPYIEIPPLHLFGPTMVHLAGRAFTIPELSIKPFGTLVAIGVWFASEIIRRNAPRNRVDQQKMSSFVFAVLLGGFIGGHVLDSIFYHPDHVLADPLSLLRIWDGQSSFGGFTGAFCGLLYWWWKHKEAPLRYADVMGSSFPAGWVFGRMGCSVAHDHPGMLSDAWFAVKYPGGARFDLGLYEMLLTIPLAITFYFLAKKPRPAGFFNGILCMAYAPTRFALDFLRVREGDMQGADPRYGGLTPAQWGCVLLLAAGVTLFWYSARSVEKGTNEPPLPAPSAPPTSA